MRKINSCRKRKRRPTLTPRFGGSTIALEIGLIRQSMEIQRELERQERKNEAK